MVVRLVVSEVGRLCVDHCQAAEVVATDLTACLDCTFVATAS
jgi:selenocysteine lyase/cysteine desulfurase